MRARAEHVIEEAARRVDVVAEGQRRRVAAAPLQNTIAQGWSKSQAEFRPPIGKFGSKHCEAHVQALRRHPAVGAGATGEGVAARLRVTDRAREPEVRDLERHALPAPTGLRLEPGCTSMQ